MKLRILSVNPVASGVSRIIQNREEIRSGSRRMLPLEATERERHRLRSLLMLLLAACLAALAGCTPVKPWQRGKLAGYIMRGDRDPLGLAQDEHIFFSREAASGGRGVGGGGCGCN